MIRSGDIEKWHHEICYFMGDFLLFLNVIKEKEKINDFKTKAYIRFLISKNAPDILAVGLHFELFVGSKKVAYGLILQESDYLFDFHEEDNK